MNPKAVTEQQKVNYFRRNSCFEQIRIMKNVTSLESLQSEMFKCEAARVDLMRATEQPVQFSSRTHSNDRVEASSTTSTPTMNNKEKKKRDYSNVTCDFCATRVHGWRLCKGYKALKTGDQQKWLKEQKELREAAKARAEAAAATPTPPKN